MTEIDSVKAMILEDRREINSLKESVLIIQHDIRAAARELDPESAAKAQAHDRRGFWRYTEDGIECMSCGAKWDVHPKAKYCPFCGVKNSWSRE